jgi:hypothetical protein
MRKDRRAAAVGVCAECGPAPVVILSGRGIAPDEEIVAAEACYPRVIAKLKMVEVRAR